MTARNFSKLISSLISELIPWVAEELIPMSIFLGLLVILPGLFLGLLSWLFSGMPISFQGLFQWIIGTLTIAMWVIIFFVAAIIAIYGTFLMICMPFAVSFLPVILPISVFEEDLTMRSKPNQGVWNAVQNTILTMLLSCVISITLVAGMASLPVNITHMISDGKSLESIINEIYVSFARSSFPGINAVLFLGFWIGGGITVIQHLTLRIILTRHYHLPWNLAQFLTYCHERRLLQQIGGRYRFIHRELLDHFAGKEI
jgi:hypothetical protein